MFLFQRKTQNSALVNVGGHVNMSKVESDNYVNQPGAVPLLTHSLYILNQIFFYLLYFQKNVKETQACRKLLI